MSATSDEVTWASPETFGENPNTNALRWGTMYNFWFDADAEPGTGAVTLGLFKPHTPSELSAIMQVPAAAVDCPADLDGDGDVGTSDLLILPADWDTPDSDITGDGTTGTSDLLVLLADWGPC